MKERCDVPFQLLLTQRHRKMLESLAFAHQRSMNGMVRIIIERAYHAEMLRAAEAAGRASASGRAAGRS